MIGIKLDMTEKKKKLGVVMIVSIFNRASDLLFRLNREQNAEGRKRGRYEDIRITKNVYGKIVGIDEISSDS
jgi:cob(I)alamin adenosyltransferase